MKRSYIVLILAAVLAFNINTSPSYSAQQSRAEAKRIYREFKKKLSNDRNAYPNLTDEDFANFREVKTTGISRGKLYRSSSPINDWGKRNLIADSLSEENGIRTFINLVDTDKQMKSYKGFSGTYYSKHTAIALNLNLKFMSKDFQKKFAQGVKFIARTEPPYLIHCNLGKDRTGLFCAVIEALMGASFNEISADYMTSFYNYFGVKPDTNNYNFVINNEIRPFLASMLGVKNLDEVNLPAAAERYLLRIGVTAEEIMNVRAKLSQP